MKTRDPTVFKQYKSARNAVCKDILKSCKETSITDSKTVKKEPLNLLEIYQ